MSLLSEFKVAMENREKIRSQLFDELKKKRKTITCGTCGVCSLW